MMIHVRIYTEVSFYRISLWQDIVNINYKIIFYLLFIFCAVINCISPCAYQLTFRTGVTIQRKIQERLLLTSTFQCSTTRVFAPVRSQTEVLLKRSTWNTKNQFRISLLHHLFACVFFFKKSTLYWQKIIYCKKDVKLYK